VHGGEETLHLDRVQFATGSHSGAYIQSKRAHLINCLTHVFRRESSRQKYRNADAFPDGTAERPIVSSARAAEFLDRQFLVAGIEQDRIHMRGDVDRFLDGLGAGHMDNLNDRNPGQGVFQIVVRADSEMVADLYGVRAAEALLLNDLADALSGGQQKCSDGRWHYRRDL